MAGAIPKSGTLDKTQVGKKPTAKTAPKKAPSKAVAKREVAKVDTGDFTPAKAKAHTEKIKKGLQSTVDLLHEAWQGRIWLTLGLKTWDDYIKQEFDSAPLALPMAKRKPTVASLADRGWSSRAISSATGVNQATVVRDINSAKDSEPTDAKLITDDGEVIEAEIVDDEPESRTVTGLDGKEREVTAKPVKAATPPAVVNVVSVAKVISKDLAAITVRLGALYDREDYDENMVKVDEVLQQAIDDFAAEVGERLPELEDAPV